MPAPAKPEPGPDSSHGALVAALRPRPIPVETPTIATGPIVVSVLEEGQTRIRHRHLSSPPVAGLLQRVALRAGAVTEAGKTVLAMLEAQPASFLDPRAQGEGEARVEGAEAAKLQRESQIERARSSLQLAEREMARAEKLNRSGAIATRDRNAAASQVDVLTRELHTAEFALAVANFELAQAQAALIQAQTPSSAKPEPYAILAPVASYVLNVREESARLVTPGTPIMEVGDPTDLEAEIELLSSDAVGVGVGAEVSIEQWGGAPLRGRVSVVEPGGYTEVSALGVEEQRVKGRVDFLDPLPPGKTLRDRYRVEARIVTWRAEDVLQIPTGAFFRRGGDWMTFVLKGDKARPKKVEIAHHNGLAAEVRRGLTAGQRVILHPPDALADGTSVQTTPEP